MITSMYTLTQDIFIHGLEVMRSKELTEGAGERSAVRSSAVVQLRLNLIRFPLERPVESSHVIVDFCYCDSTANL